MPRPKELGCSIGIVKDGDGAIEAGVIENLGYIENRDISTIVWYNSNKVEIEAFVVPMIQEVATTRSSMLVGVDGATSLILINSAHTGRRFDRYLLHELTHLDDYCGNPMIDMTSIDDTCQFVVMNAIKDAKCEQECINSGYGDIIIEDIIKYSNLDPNKIREDAKVGAGYVDVVLRSLISRAIYFSIIPHFRNDVKGIFRALNELNEVTFFGERLLLKNLTRRAVLDSIIMTADGMPDESPHVISESVNRLLRRLCRSPRVLIYDQSQNSFYLIEGIDFWKSKQAMLYAQTTI